MFEIAPLGAIFIVVGLSYLYLLSPRLVPERRVQKDVSATYSLKDYLTEFLVPQDSPLVGKTISESGLDTEYELQVLGVHRSGSYIWEGLQTVTIQAEDHLIARVSIDEVLSLTDRGWLSASIRDINPAEEIRKDDVGIAEAIIGADSNLTGQLLGDINFRNRYGVFVLAVRSRERTLQKNLEDVELNYGDTLLIQGPREQLAEVGNSPDFLLIEEREVQPVRWKKSPWTLAIMAAVIVLAVTRVLPIMVSAFLGALAVVAFGTLTNQEAYQAIRWPVVFLLAGILPLGIAFENTGAAGWIAQTAIMPLEQWGPHALIGGMYLITSLLTELMSNNSTAVLLTPIALNVAQLLEVSSRPLLVTVMFAASASFMTPIGYKTNTMVYGTGGYRFTDFMRLGVPLNLLFALIAAIAIPLIWPF
jgi:di/tricarboxylate transporter